MLHAPFLCRPFSFNCLLIFYFHTLLSFTHCFTMLAIYTVCSIMSPISWHFFLTSLNNFIKLAKQRYEKKLLQQDSESSRKDSWKMVQKRTKLNPEKPWIQLAVLQLTLIIWLQNQLEPNDLVKTFFCTRIVMAQSILSSFIRNKCYAQFIKPPLSGLALTVNNLQMSLLTQIQCSGCIHLQEDRICMFDTFL